MGSKRTCSAPIVTPMRPPKRNTLTFKVAVLSILKFIGSIKIDINKQNRSDQLFEFQIEERIFPPWSRTNINKAPLCYHRIDVIFLVYNNRPVSICNSFTIFADNSEIEIYLSICMPKVFQKNFSRRKQRQKFSSTCSI